MFYSRVIFLPALLLLLTSMYACSGGAEEPTAEQVELSLNQSMVVYGGDGLDEEPFLGSVGRVIADSQGNSYVFGGDAMQFLKYDAEGNYLHSFGREGSGPGEIQGLSTMFADSQGRLIVADGGNSRITIFDGKDGTFLANEPQHGIQSIRDISEMEDGRFLVMGWHPEREGMIHIMNADFSEIELSLADPEMIFTSENGQFTTHFRSMAGSAEMLNDGRILFAPRVYSGSLYLYEEGEESWVLADTVSGWSAVEEPFQTVSGGSMDMMERFPVSSVISIAVGEGGMTITYLASSSHGLYPTDDRSFINISSYISEEDEIYQMVLERFDAETLTLNRYGTVPLELSNSRTRWIDRQGFLYQTHPDSVGFWKMDVGGL